MNERHSDFDLLRGFLRSADQAAFTQLVQRHLDLVYATAFRKVQDAGAAQEVAQNVFAALSRKAWQFAPDDSLPAWLYKTALLESKEWLRGELRRRRREQAATELGTTMKNPDDQPALRALVPLLDEALLSLREKDRTALLLRFYENLPLKELGGALGVREDAAQKRVTSALGKLSAFFQRRGFKTATVAATTAALQQTAGSAPVGVLNAIVLATEQFSPPALLGLAGMAARLASWTKVQTAVVCIALTALPLGWKWRENRLERARLVQVQTQLAASQTDLSSLRAQIERLKTTSTRLNAALADETAAARKRADAEERFAAWKNRLRAELMASDYHWPEDSPFVRIPKSVVKQLETRQSVRPPGVLAQATRELLGLTPQERQQIEGSLRDHFANTESLITQRAYETNQTSGSTQFSVPSSAVASRMWFIPALGDQVNEGSQQLQEALQSTLGNERWALVEPQLALVGTDTLRRVLNLDAVQSAQEVGVWISQSGGKLMVGYGWSSNGGAFSQDGAPLERFMPGVQTQPGIDPNKFFSLHALPSVLTERMLEWVQQQAVAMTEKGGAK